MVILPRLATGSPAPAPPSSAPRLQPGFAQDVVELASRRDPAHPLKIMLVHSSHTGGHRSAADSLEKALQELPNVKVENLNTLSLSSQRLQNTQARFYRLVSDQLPTLRRLGFECALRGYRAPCWVANMAMHWKAWRSPEVLAHIQAEKPDLIVSTHSQTNSMLAYWKDKGKIQAPIHSCPTDFLVHLMWKHDPIERYYVASPAAQADLERFGVDSSRITVTGIPVRPGLAAPAAETPAQLKERLGLHPDKPVVVVTGGSLGQQPFSKIVGELDKLPEDFQVVCVTARNQEAKDELDKLTPRHPLKVLGFVSNMDEWLGASDVVLTKPGGLTCSEILALGKPMIFVNPYPGLEQRQITRLVGDGVAASAEDVPAAAREIQSMLTDPTRRLQLTSKVAALGQPASAYRVAEYLVRAAAGGRPQGQGCPDGSGPLGP